MEAGGFPMTQSGGAVANRNQERGERHFVRGDLVVESSLMLALNEWFDLTTNQGLEVLAFREWCDQFDQGV